MITRLLHILMMISCRFQQKSQISTTLTLGADFSMVIAFLQLLEFVAITSAIIQKSALTFESAISLSNLPQASTKQ